MAILSLRCLLGNKVYMSSRKLNVCLEIRGYVYSEIKWLAKFYTEKWVELGCCFFLTKAQRLPKSQTGIDYQLDVKFSSATKSACGRNFLCHSSQTFPGSLFVPPTHGWKDSYFNIFSVCQADYIVKELLGKR